MDHSLYRKDLREVVFGPFYAIAAATGQIEPIPRSGPKIFALLGFLPSLLSLIFLVARAAYMIYRSNQAGVMSLDWCYATSLNYIALHAGVSCLILMGMKYQKFIPNFLDLLLIASRNKIPIISRKFRIRSFFLMGLYIIASLLYCIENEVRYKDFEVDGKIRDTAQFRKSMFIKQYLFPIDIAIILWGALISAIALCLVSCMNRGLCFAYKEFNAEIKFLIQNGEIKNTDRLYDIEDQIIDFIKAHQYLYQTSFIQGLSLITFSSGILINISSQIGLRTLPKGSNAMDTVMLSFWLVMSIGFLVYSMLRPTEFYICANETKDMLLLEKSLWINNDSQTRELAYGLTDRLDKLIGNASTIIASRSAFFAMNLILLVIPFIADVLSAFIKAADGNGSGYNCTTTAVYASTQTTTS